jgi:hypothetical protein
MERDPLHVLDQSHVCIHAYMQIREGGEARRRSCGTRRGLFAATYLSNHVGTHALLIVGIQ